MTQTQQHCRTPDQLLTFLRGQLTSQEESELQLHLNDCVSCRERLENAAADSDSWNEARQFFGSEAMQASPDDSNGDHEEATQGSQRIRQVLDTLGPTDDPESLGRIGGYEVTGVVGAGGMGVVLKAHDRSLDRIVAIKVMSPHLASSGSARKRFAREAKAAAAVLHPNVIAIHSVASEDTSPFLVMPYVRGASLQKRIDSQGPLPLKDTLRIGAQIAAGLAAAHEQGLVHRDIKPANILLEEGVERVTITDFGLARAVDDASMTCSGVIAGTPQYMSPEQTRGEPIDARSDLFSLGSVLYAMCAGRSPFRAETTYGVLHRIANDNPTSVTDVNSDVPVWLGHIIERLMAKRPDDRFESAAQVAELLEGCLAHVQQPTTTPLPVALQLASPSPVRVRVPTIVKWIASAMFSFLLFFAGVVIVLEWNKGTLTIESDVDAVPIRIKQGDEVVERLTVTKSPLSLRIAAGTYVVEVDGDFPDVTIKNGRVTLGRGGSAKVEAAEKSEHSSDQSPNGYWEFSTTNAAPLTLPPGVQLQAIYVRDKLLVIERADTRAELYHVEIIPPREDKQFVDFLIDSVDKRKRWTATGTIDEAQNGQLSVHLSNFSDPNIENCVWKLMRKVQPTQQTESDGVNRETLAEMRRSREPDQLERQDSVTDSARTELDGDWVLRAYIDSHGTALELEWADAPYLRIRGNEISYDKGRNPSSIQVDVQNRTLTYQKDSERTPSTYHFHLKGKQLTLRTENDSVLYYSRNSTAHVEDKTPTELEGPWYLESVEGKPNTFVAETRMFRGNRCELRSADGQQSRQGEVDPFEKWMLTYSTDAGGRKFETNEKYELAGQKLMFVDQHSGCVYHYRRYGQ